MVTARKIISKYKEFHESVFLAFLSSNKSLLLIILGVTSIKFILFLWGGLNFDFVAHPDETWLSIWHRWDGKVYTTIAASGYSPTDVKPDYVAFLSHFPPLYPLLIAGASALTNLSLPHAGILVSFSAIVAASCLLFKLVYHDFKSERIAWLSVFFLNIYPTSYFTIGVHAESVFLFLVIASFYYLNKNKLILSGLAAGGSLLTRIPGVIFIPFYFFYFLYVRKKRGHFDFKIIYPVLLCLTAFVIYLVVNKAYYGEFFYFLTEKLSFYTTKHLILPLKETFLQLLAINLSNVLDYEFMIREGWNAIFTTFALVITAVGILYKVPWTYSVYSLSSILFFASYSSGMSNARYTLPIFPIFIVLGHIKNKYLLAVLTVIFITLLFYFSKIYVNGTWAF